MASILGQIANKSTSNCINKDEVYIATVPLRASKGPGQLLMSTAYSLNFWNLKHYMVIIKPSFPQFNEALVYDFQPKNPENILVAITALSGKKVPGVILERKLRKIPRKNCWFVGCSNRDEDGIHHFNESWDKYLKINHHDCTDYTKGGYSFTS
ncbi:membrane trafficking regulatory protein [Lithospermum erythrorhizon]|uniref:Membrane trafficking regulatory protein n=1 Tax=Lithospermum erythrorhizon TaxID=34254 RepID=A0AAV3PWG9_LITER